MDLVEWERFGYRQGLSRPEIEHMSLREYVLRRQAHIRDYMETIRLKTLPLLNAWTEEAITAEDFFDTEPAQMSEDDRQALKALRYDVEQQVDEIDDFSLVDEQLQQD